jgi:hypothetical protein
LLVSKVQSKGSSSVHHPLLPSFFFFVVVVVVVVGTVSTATVRKRHFPEPI